MLDFVCQGYLCNFFLSSRINFISVCLATKGGNLIQGKLEIVEFEQSRSIHGINSNSRGVF